MEEEKAGSCSCLIKLWVCPILLMAVTAATLAAFIRLLLAIDGLPAAVVTAGGTEHGRPANKGKSRLHLLAGAKGVGGARSGIRPQRGRRPVVGTAPSYCGTLAALARSGRHRQGGDDRNVAKIVEGD
ncbi:hypothetical protein MUK42_12453 [Musa troglodytarum]|uniref:Uncharacterized protein n=1 Tax=Musa troglodytarum TaxID=320322 RepID=A0A9E7GPU4_9LILI|nr:hypothetical protein MUK42_12453 [Musa troglodytarum]